MPVDSRGGNATDSAWKSRAMCNDGSGVRAKGSVQWVFATAGSPADPKVHQFFFSNFFPLSLEGQAASVEGQLTKIHLASS